MVLHFSNAVLPSCLFVFLTFQIIHPSFNLLGEYNEDNINSCSNLVQTLGFPTERISLSCDTSSFFFSAWASNLKIAPPNKFWHHYRPWCFVFDISNQQLNISFPLNEQTLAAIIWRLVMPTEVPTRPEQEPPMVVTILITEVTTT